MAAANTVDGAIRGDAFFVVFGCVFVCVCDGVCECVCECVCEVGRCVGPLMTGSPGITGVLSVGVDTAAGLRGESMGPVCPRAGVRPVGVPSTPISRIL